MLGGLERRALGFVDGWGGRARFQTGFWGAWLTLPTLLYGAALLVAMDWLPPGGVVLVVVAMCLVPVLGAGLALLSVHYNLRADDRRRTSWAARHERGLDRFEMLYGQGRLTAARMDELRAAHRAYASPDSEHARLERRGRLMTGIGRLGTLLGIPLALMGVGMVVGGTSLWLQRGGAWDFLDDTSFVVFWGLAVLVPGLPGAAFGLALWVGGRRRRLEARALTVVRGQELSALERQCLDEANRHEQKAAPPRARRTAKAAA